jgi:CspA family cold shock protein
MSDRRPGLFQDEAFTGRQVEAKVKWFNASKGFGFVTLGEGTQDAFLPMAILRRAGYEDVREGASITCEIGDGAKGPLVTAVLNVDNTSAVPSRSAGFDRRAPRTSTTMEGAVKWFEPDKGYGFISPDGGGRDVFIHITALRRSGIEMLGPGQRVRAEVVDGRKGLEADSIALI